MEVTFQTLFNIAITLVWVLAGFMLRRTVNKLDHLDMQDRKLVEQIYELQIALPKCYASKEDFRQAIDRIMKKLDLIELKLDGKADKA